MSTAQSVIDDIDALVEEQLAAGESTGECHGIRNFPQCRCRAQWHGLPTPKCPGSDAEGPMVPSGARGVGLYQQGGTWGQESVEAQMEAFRALGRVVSAEWDRIRAAFSNLSAAMHGQLLALNPDVAQTADRADGRPVLPFPARTPPMWAVDATRTRRRRHL